MAVEQEIVQAQSTVAIWARCRRMSRCQKAARSASLRSPALSVQGSSPQRAVGQNCRERPTSADASSSGPLHQHWLLPSPSEHGARRHGVPSGWTAGRWPTQLYPAKEAPAGGGAEGVSVQHTNVQAPRRSRRGVPSSRVGCRVEQFQPCDVQPTTDEGVSDFCSRWAV